MTLKAIHIASFIGNVGDNANHAGFRSNFKELINKDYSYDEVEIRDFYFSIAKRKFDEQFITEVNKYDLVIFGGGNFFEISFPNSKTGTTFDIDLNVLDQIETKMFFNGVGFDPEKGATGETISKFEAFIDFASKDDRFFISFRNDGSIHDFNKIYPNKNCNIHVVPDGGFFLPESKRLCDYLNKERKYIAINVAGDMTATRHKKNNDSISFDSFITKFSNNMNEFLTNYPEYDLIFTAHIYKDYLSINKILNTIDDMKVRKRVIVAPYIQGDGYEKLFDMYNNVELVIGNRFHANVCPIGLNIPTIGIGNYPKIAKLYSELGLEGRVVDVTQDQFDDLLTDKIKDTISRREDIVLKYKAINEKLDKELKKTYSALQNWIDL